ncbi:MAG: UDP-N-acetylmuramoyl-L-alanyl-D-glutamate--2,6-diaminopimelate ligase [Firmicutes bacterium]|nr:UDP-N-acetylmuramoyl-L-alanyl-D-glutamate--2,6-diaminopimelate ligase [Bacillota bacterium]
MQVRELLDLGVLLQGDPEVVVTGVAYDSRRTRPGDLFVAIRGFRDNGHRYLEEALQNGARALMVEEPLPVPVPLSVPVIRVPSARQALADAACRLHGHPSRRLRVIGVTGTNGKTTTTHLIRSILMERGDRVGLVGTVHNYIGDDILPVEHTTPESADLQHYLARMVAAGSRYAVMEVSSHALALHRVRGVEFDVGVFTNLTQDHLDFHRDMDDYRETKGRLFASLGVGATKPGPRAAVLNADDPASARYRELCQVPVVTYGLRPGADLWARDVEVRREGAAFTLVSPQGEVRLRLRLTGLFNVYNALAAAAVGLVEGVDLATVRRALERTQGVAGRLEPVDAGQPFGVFVDYAHTPDGLENVLRTVRAFTEGRIILVFGCGGDRDPAKRPKMGAVAGRLADYVIVTSDNPRSEDPEQIIAQILAGVRATPLPPDRYEAEVDRARAIARAIALAQPGDVVLIAGKGHETYQIFKDRTIPFDDREVARQVLAEQMARRRST